MAASSSSSCKKIHQNKRNHFNLNEKETEREEFDHTFTKRLKIKEDDPKDSKHKKIDTYPSSSSSSSNIYSSFFDHLQKTKIDNSFLPRCDTPSISPISPVFNHIETCSKQNQDKLTSEQLMILEKELVRMKEQFSDVLYTTIRDQYDRQLEFLTNKFQTEINQLKKKDPKVDFY